MFVCEYSVNVWRRVGLEQICVWGRLTKVTVVMLRTTRQNDSCVSHLWADFLKVNLMATELTFFFGSNLCDWPLLWCILDFCRQLFCGPDVMLGASVQMTTFIILGFAFLVQPTCTVNQKEIQFAVDYDIPLGGVKNNNSYL